MLQESCSINDPLISCAVPSCNSSSARTPNKKFFQAPSKPSARLQWLKAAQIEIYVSTNPNIYFCEDHFESKRKILASTPTKFECQIDRESTLNEYVHRLTAKRKLVPQRNLKKKIKTDVPVPTVHEKKPLILRYILDKSKLPISAPQAIKVNKPSIITRKMPPLNRSPSERQVMLFEPKLKDKETNRIPPQSLAGKVLKIDDKLISDNKRLMSDDHLFKTGDKQLIPDDSQTKSNEKPSNSDENLLESEQSSNNTKHSTKLLYKVYKANDSSESKLLKSNESIHYESIFQPLNSNSKIDSDKSTTSSNMPVPPVLPHHSPMEVDEVSHSGSKKKNKRLLKSNKPNCKKKLLDVIKRKKDKERNILSSSHELNNIYKEVLKKSDELINCCNMVLNSEGSGKNNSNYSSSNKLLKSNGEAEDLLKSDGSNKCNTNLSLKSSDSYSSTEADSFLSQFKHFLRSDKLNNSNDNSSLESASKFHSNHPLKSDDFNYHDANSPSTSSNSSNNDRKKLWKSNNLIQNKKRAGLMQAGDLNKYNTRSSLRSRNSKIYTDLSEPNSGDSNYNKNNSKPHYKSLLKSDKKRNFKQNQKCLPLKPIPSLPRNNFNVSKPRKKCLNKRDFLLKAIMHDHNYTIYGRKQRKPRKPSLIVHMSSEPINLNIINQNPENIERTSESLIQEQQVHLNENFYRINRKNNVNEKAKQEDTDSVDSFETFHCNYCEVEYINIDLLNKHIQKDHHLEEADSAESFGTFKCYYCENEFINLGLLNDHMQEDHLEAHQEHNEDEEPLDIKPEIFQCNNCPSSFVSKTDMLSHLQIMHPDYPEIIQKLNGDFQGTNDEITIETEKTISPNDIFENENDRAPSNFLATLTPFVNLEDDNEETVTNEQIGGYNFDDYQAEVEVKIEPVDSNDCYAMLYPLNKLPNSAENADKLTNQINDEKIINEVLEDTSESQQVKSAPEKNTIIFECQFCYTPVEGKMNLAQHLTEQHSSTIKSKLIQCKDCLIFFATDEDLLDHLYRKINSKSKSCYFITKTDKSKNPKSNKTQNAKTKTKSPRKLKTNAIRTHKPNNRTSKRKKLIDIKKKILANQPEVRIQRCDAYTKSDLLTPLIDGTNNELLTPIRVEEEKILVLPYDPTICIKCLKPLENLSKFDICEKCSLREQLIATEAIRRKSEEINRTQSEDNFETIFCNICYVRCNDKLDLREHVSRSHL